MGNAVASADSRCAGIELVRVLSCDGVATFHLLPASEASFTWARTIGYSGLFALTAVMASLAISRRAAPLPVLLKRRAGRLLVPWMFWCAVFGGLMIARRVARGVPPISDVQWYELLIGPRIHLWFLPFAFAVSVAVALVFRPTTAVRRAAAGLVIVAIPVAIGAVQLAQVSLPWKLYLTALPAVLLGAALGRPGVAAAQEIERGVICAACLIASVLTAGLLEESQAAAAYGAAALLLAGCLAWQAPPPRWLAKAGSLSLGVYLAHPLCSDVLWTFTASRPPLHVLATVAASAGLVAVMQATPLRRFV